MDNINVYYTKIDSNFPKEKFDEFYNELPNILKNKIDRLKRYKSKLHSLIGLQLLKTSLSDFNFSNKILEKIRYKEDGKPYIPNSFCFNISHSENIIICACYNSNIGVDIEKIMPRNINKLQTFISKDEFIALSNSTNQDQLFAKIWTQKEAFSKAIGSGMNLSFADINITNLKVMHKNEFWYLYPLNIDKKYFCHICVADNKKAIRIKEVNILY